MCRVGSGTSPIGLPAWPRSREDQGMAQLLRVQNFMLSMDGFGAGEGQSLEAPFGHADRRGGPVARLPADLVSWAGATASWPNRSEPGGSRGLDDYFTRDFA